MLKLKKLDSDCVELIDIGERVSIGRSTDNDIVIESDDISRHHCLITRDMNNNVFVEDLGSLNGTIINDKNIKRARVEHKDVMQIGDETYIFIDVDDVKTIRLKTESLIDLKSILFNEYTKEIIESIKIKLLHNGSKEYHFPSGSIYTIGRLDICDFIVNDDSVSRTHATIDVRENRVVLTDSNSTNGTFVNKIKITQKALNSGDVIGVGDSQFIVHFDVSGKNFYSSLRKSVNVRMIDLLQDFENVIRIYESEYSINVLLESERQTLILCQEFEQLLQPITVAKKKIFCIVDFINLLSGAMCIVDPETNRILAGETIDEDVLTQDIIQLLASIASEGGKGTILYFEDFNPDGSVGVRMNGIYANISNDIQLLMLRVSQSNLLYMVYAASWMSRFYLEMNEKI